MMGLMVRLLSVVFAFVFFSCNEKDKCMSYPEALKQGKVSYKTTVFSLDKGKEYKLDYVADGEYKNSVGYCYGRLELKHNEFAELASEIAPGYNPENVAMITMFGGGKDICNNEYYQSEDIKNYLVYYR